MKSSSHYISCMKILKSLSIVVLIPVCSVQAFHFDWDVTLDHPFVTDRCQTERMRSIDFFEGRRWCDRSRTPEKLGHELRVFLDAGHGGKDRGARGNGVSEKWLSLEIARMVRKDVEKLSQELSIPIRVRMSREEDTYVSLHDRVATANQWPADVFVSIHANWSPLEKVRGFEVYFLSPEASDAEARRLVQMENNTMEKPIKSDILNILTDLQNTRHIEESSVFAEKIYRRLSMGRAPNGAGVRQGPFTVLSGTAMPAVLVEVGFISNPIEVRHLRREDYLRSLAGAISSGIVDFVLASNGFFAS